LVLRDELLDRILIGEWIG